MKKGVTDNWTEGEAGKNNNKQRPTKTNNRIKQAPPVRSAIDNAIVYLCVRSAKAGEGRLLYSMDVGFN